VAAAHAVGLLAGEALGLDGRVVAEAVDAADLGGHRGLGGGAGVDLLLRDPRPKDLTLLCFTAGFESDLLVGAGCVKTVRSVYFGLESFGFAPMFTEKANRGEIDICEETESSLAMGLRAQMAGVGFMPSTA